MNVWKFGGAVCLEALDDIAEAIHRAGPMAILHGAGPQLDAALAQFGTPRRIAGLRITTPEAAQVVLETMDDVGSRMVQGLLERGIDAVHIPAASGWLGATPKAIPQGDLQRVGRPIAVASDAIRKALRNGQVPIVTPVGMDGDGPLNVNADEAAQALAIALHANAMFLVTDVPQVRDDDGPVAAMDVARADQLIADGVANGGMVPKLQNAFAALDAGVPEVRIGTIETLSNGRATRLLPRLVHA